MFRHIMERQTVAMECLAQAAVRQAAVFERLPPVLGLMAEGLDAVARVTSPSEHARVRSALARVRSALAAYQGSLGAARSSLDGFAFAAGVRAAKEPIPFPTAAASPGAPAAEVEPWHRVPRDCDKGEACKPWTNPRHWVTEVPDGENPTPPIQSTEQTTGPERVLEVNDAEVSEAIRSLRTSKAPECQHGLTGPCPECDDCPELEELDAEDPRPSEAAPIRAPFSVPNGEDD